MHADIYSSASLGWAQGLYVEANLVEAVCAAIDHSAGKRAALDLPGQPIKNSPHLI